MARKQLSRSVCSLAPDLLLRTFLDEKIDFLCFFFVIEHLRKKLAGYDEANNKVPCRAFVLTQEGRTRRLNTTLNEAKKNYRNFCNVTR